MRRMLAIALCSLPLLAACTPAQVQAAIHYDQTHRTELATSAAEDDPAIIQGLALCHRTFHTCWLERDSDEVLGVYGR